MPEASNSLEKRKRGGQPGNGNRLVHGRYTQKRAARRVALRAIRRKGRALAILVKNVLKARETLKRRRAARALAAGTAMLPASLRAKPRRVRRRRNTARQNRRSAICIQRSRSPPKNAATTPRTLSK